MRDFLVINPITPGVERPFGLNDVQDLWDGLNTLAGSYTGSGPKILWGFDVLSDGTTLSQGVIVYGGKAYYAPNTTGYVLSVGDTLFVGTEETGDTRQFADGLTKSFSSKQVCKNATFSGATNLGTLSLANLDAWKASYIGDGTVTSSKIPDNAILPRHIPDASIPGDKLVSVPVEKITGNTRQIAVSSGSMSFLIGESNVEDRNLTMSNRGSDPGFTFNNGVIVTDITESGLWVSKRQKFAVTAPEGYTFIQGRTIVQAFNVFGVSARAGFITILDFDASDPNTFGFCTNDFNNGASGTIAYVTVQLFFAKS